MWSMMGGRQRLWRSHAPAHPAACHARRVSASAADLATETRKLYDGVALAGQALASGNADVENSAITKEAFADRIAAEILPALTLAQETWSAAADGGATAG